MTVDVFGIVWLGLTATFMLPLGVIATCWAIREVRKIWRGEW